MAGRPKQTPPSSGKSCTAASSRWPTPSGGWPRSAVVITAFTESEVGFASPGPPANHSPAEPAPARSLLSCDEYPTQERRVEGEETFDDRERGTIEGLDLRPSARSRPGDDVGLAVEVRIAQ